MACVSSLGFAAPTKSALFAQGALDAMDMSPTPGWRETDCPSFGVPRGCVVRNTFLEWQSLPYHGDDDSDVQKREDGLPVTPSPCSSENGSSPSPSVFPWQQVSAQLRRSRRSFSCPPEVAFFFLSSDSSQGTDDEEQMHYPEACKAAARDATSRAYIEKSADAEASPSVRDRWSGHDQSCNEDNNAGVDLGRYERAAAEDDICSWREESYRSWTSGSSKRGGKALPTRPSKQGRLLLRGLPFTVSIEEVMTFLKDAGVMDSLASSRPVQLLQNQQGRPSGFAEVQLAPSADYWEIREHIHMQRLGGRYIEVLPPSHGKWSGGQGASTQGVTSSRSGGRGGASWRRDR